MSLDPTNPSVLGDQSLIDWRVKDIAAKEKAAEAATLMAQAASGEPVTEGGIYASFLRAVLMGRLAASSNDAQIWATDLTKDYLLKYDLAGNPRQQ
jgi:hypothetical protein